MKHGHGTPQSRRAGILRRLLVVACLLAWFVPGLGGAADLSSTTNDRAFVLISSGEHHDGGCASHADGHPHAHCSMVHVHACCALAALSTTLLIGTSCAFQLAETPAVASLRVPPPLRPPAPLVA